MDSSESIGGKIALKHGLAYGLSFLIVLSLGAIHFSDGLLGYIGIAAMLAYNYLIISFLMLYISFSIALWYFGKRNALNILKGKSTIKTSAEFSFGVNLIIWSIFLITQLGFGGFEEPFYLKLVVLGLIAILGTLTTFTLGLYLVKLTEERIKRP